jgi:phosphohistidine phosphatase
LKTLFLLRHCEANQFDEKTTDHNKELNEKGKNEAILLKKWFEDNNINFDFILSSTARRTLETTYLLFDNIKDKVNKKKELYLCGYKEIIKELKLLDNNLNNTLVVGHEPSISETLRFLIASFRPDLGYVSNSLYPTGGLAILHFSIKSWTDLDEKTGVLDAFIAPDYLKQNEQ